VPIVIPAKAGISLRVPIVIPAKAGISLRVPIVIPAKAGISLRLFARLHQEVPAFAGMTTARGDDAIYSTTPDPSPGSPYAGTDTAWQ